MKNDYLRAKENYPWMLHAYSCKYRCTNPNRKSYSNYGGKGIKFLLTNEEVKFLWFRDKAYEMKQPSLDRINSKNNYIFDNCQFIEHNINCSKDGKKPILQYDLNGNFIREWESITQAAKYYNVNTGNIGHVLSNKCKSCRKFFWKYKE